MTQRYLTVFFMIAALQISALADKVLIFRQGSINFEEVANSVKDEISEDFEVVEHILSKDSDYQDFKGKVTKEKPSLLILLDNQAVDFAKKFNMENDEYAKNLRSVAAMGLNLRKEIEGNPNICGIEYEVPAYTMITQFRYFITNDIKNVLVFYRKSQHSEMIKVAQEQLGKEGITLKAMDTEEYGDKKQDVNFFLNRNVLREVYKKDTDLVWVISDSILLNNDNFAEVWVSAARRLKKPFIAGIKAFSGTDMGFCVYSASPNHQDLGNQIAEQVFTLMDDEEMKADEVGVEYILSVVKNVNMKILPEYKLVVDEEKMSDVEANK
ncbi:MAG: hypothetical protein MK132_11300 [Lentisphaerales bacterium]|nr:hypothetical protein [Lentisphaerales bacterium]